MTIPDLLTPAEVADQLKISRRQVYNLVSDPDCPLEGVRIGGKTLRIYAVSVAATVARGAVHATS